MMALAFVPPILVFVMSASSSVLKEQIQTPVIHECDLCVIGGSCTGLFAAIRAARLGLSVAIVEMQNCFGGVATSSMVNIWHSLLDAEYRETIIGGLTVEVVERLQRREAVRTIEKNHGAAFIFNSEELKTDLDEIAQEHGLKIYFHTQFVAPWVEDGKLQAVVVENKSGRGAIRARFFIDASGDADLASSWVGNLLCQSLATCHHLRQGVRLVDPDDELSAGDL